MGTKPIVERSARIGFRGYSGQYSFPSDSVHFGARSSEGDEEGLDLARVLLANAEEQDDIPAQIRAHLLLAYLSNESDKHWVAVFKLSENLPPNRCKLLQIKACIELGLRAIQESKFRNADGYFQDAEKLACEITPGWEPEIQKRIEGKIAKLCSQGLMPAEIYSLWRRARQGTNLKANLTRALDFAMSTQNERAEIIIRLEMAISSYLNIRESVKKNHLEIALAKARNNGELKMQVEILLAMGEYTKALKLAQGLRDQTLIGRATEGLRKK